MLDSTESTNYIYLLKEREFIKTKEEIYKIGMTSKLNHVRFNQYPKGSVLLFQMICIDCKIIEKQIIKIFKETFINKKNIGSEYFEGNYEKMIDIIYSTIKNEKCVEKDIKTIITTRDEWQRFSNIDKIIISDINGKGFYKHNNSDFYDILYDENDPDLDCSSMETLRGIIEHFTTENNDDIIYDLEMIFQDTIKQCFKPFNLYDLKYYEYPLSIYRCEENENEGKFEFVIFNSLETKFIKIEELIGDKILINPYTRRFIKVKNIIDIEIVDLILDSLINYKTKINYKKLVYNLIVDNKKQIIFKDYGWLLTEWITHICLDICGDNSYIYSTMHNSKDIKKNKPRLVIINTKMMSKEFINIKLKYFTKIGIKNIIVNDPKDKNDKMCNYDMISYKKFLYDNNIKYQFDDDVFYTMELFYVNFLKWCCTPL